MVYKVPHKPLRARARERRRCGGSSWLRVASFCYFDCFLAAAPTTARHLLQSFSQGYGINCNAQTAGLKKEMASSADLEVQCLADAAAYIERHGWPRSRLEGWRCAPVPRVSNPAHWDPYATVSPPSRHRRDSRIAGTGSARTRKSRGAPSLSSRWSRTLCSARLVRRCGACLGHCLGQAAPIPSRTTGVVHRIPGTRPSPIVTPCVEINQCRRSRSTRRFRTNAP